MSKRRVNTVDHDIGDVAVGSTIVLEDGSLATVTIVEARDIEVKQVKKVYYLEYEAPDKKGRKQFWYSVHGDDEQVEVVQPHVGFGVRVKTFLSKFKKHSS